jgi:hypothetical protein
MDTGNLVDAGGGLETVDPEVEVSGSFNVNVSSSGILLFGQSGPSGLVTDGYGVALSGSLQRDEDTGTGQFAIEHNKGATGVSGAGISILGIGGNLSWIGGVTSSTINAFFNFEVREL